MPVLRQHKRWWIANKEGQAHGACEPAALLWEADTGEAPHDQEALYNFYILFLLTKNILLPFL